MHCSGCPRNGLGSRIGLICCQARDGAREGSVALLCGIGSAVGQALAGRKLGVFRTLGRLAASSIALPAYSVMSIRACTRAARAVTTVGRGLRLGTVGC